MILKNSLMNTDMMVVLCLYDLVNNSYLKYNPERCDQQFIPASTFKIFNSLVGLETGAVKDEFEVFKWDSVKDFMINGIRI